MILNGRTINPGELRTLVTLESRSVSTETGGFRSQSWTEEARVYGRWTNIHGGEVWTAEAVQARKPATLLLRYRSDVDLTWAVSLGGVRYQIVSIDNIQQRGEYMELALQELRSG